MSDNQRSAIPEAGGPKKKKAPNSKLGRPRNLGDEQYDHIMSGYPGYLSLKNQKAKPADISGYFNERTYDFISKYGWDNPFRSLAQDAVNPSAEACAATRTEAENAGRAIAKGDNAEKFTEQKRKDEVVTVVRGEITKQYQRKYRDGETGATKPSLDIPKLIKSIMAKPTQRQLYLVWAKLKERPDLEAEVNRRHTAAVEQDGEDASSRGAVWNAVAAEWYLAASEEDKAITLREAAKALDAETKKWEKQAAGEPSSPEEARAFMEGSEEFLAAMMQFFANRVSGVAVMFLAGPNEVNLSEAVCEVPGRSKVLYSQVAQEETTRANAELPTRSHHAAMCEETRPYAHVQLEHIREFTG